MRSITLVKVQGRRAGAAGGAGACLHACWKSPSRPAAPTRSACTWPAQGHPIAGDDKYGDFELNKALAEAGPQAHVPARLAVTVQPSRHAASASRCRRPLPPELQKFADPCPTSRPRQFRPDRLRLGRHAVRLHADHRALHPARRWPTSAARVPTDKDAAYVIGMGLTEALAHAAPDVPREKLRRARARATATTTWRTRTT